MNKRPVPDGGFAVCFVRNHRFIVYKHDSYVRCTLREFQRSYTSFYLSYLLL